MAFETKKILKNPQKLKKKKSSLAANQLTTTCATLVGVVVGVVVEVVVVDLDINALSFKGQLE